MTNVSEEITSTDLNQNTIALLQMTRISWKLFGLTVFQRPKSQPVSIFVRFCPSVPSLVFVVLLEYFFTVSSNYFYFLLTWMFKFGWNPRNSSFNNLSNNLSLASTIIRNDSTYTGSIEWPSFLLCALFWFTLDSDFVCSFVFRFWGLPSLTTRCRLSGLKFSCSSRCFTANSKRSWLCWLCC